MGFMVSREPFLVFGFCSDGFLILFRFSPSGGRWPGWIDVFPDYDSLLVQGLLGPEGKPFSFEDLCLLSGFHPGSPLCGRSPFSVFSLPGSPHLADRSPLSSLRFRSGLFLLVRRPRACTRSRCLGTWVSVHIRVALPWGLRPQGKSFRVVGLSRQGRPPGIWSQFPVMFTTSFSRSLYPGGSRAGFLRADRCGLPNSMPGVGGYRATGPQPSLMAIPDRGRPALSPALVFLPGICSWSVEGHAWSGTLLAQGRPLLQRQFALFAIFPPSSRFLSRWLVSAPYARSRPGGLGRSSVSRVRARSSRQGWPVR